MPSCLGHDRRAGWGLALQRHWDLHVHMADGGIRYLRGLGGVAVHASRREPGRAPDPCNQQTSHALTVAEELVRDNVSL